MCRGEHGGFEYPKIGGRWCDSPSERAIREYACSRGIPRSVFLGRIVQPGEADWLEDDAKAALEWQEWHNGLCTGCGVHRSDGMNPEHQFSFEATPYRCFPCQEREKRSYQWSKNHADGQAPDFGVYWAVHMDDAN